MTLASPLLYLPLLHQGMGNLTNKEVHNAAYLWPGLPEQANRTWLPSTYPFTPQEAAACLKDIQNMGEAALSGVPLQAFVTPQKTRSELKKVQEQEDIESFIATGQEPVRTEAESIHMRRAAQKFLLWAWLMEEHLLEVQKLTQNYATNATEITSALGVEKDDALAGLEYIQNLLSTDTFALPPWKLVVENMAFFLPSSCSALINHPEMAEHILENYPTQPLSDALKEVLQLEAQEHGVECTLSLSQLLQKNTPTQTSPWLEKKLHCIIVKDC